jgi:hypothetical protein
VVPENGVLLLRLAGAEGGATTDCEDAFNVTFDGSLVIECVIESYTAIQIVCSQSPALGSTFQAYIRQAWVDLPASVGYSPPIVDAVEPPLLASSGGVVAIVGRNFGAGPCSNPRRLSEVRLMMAQPPSTSAEVWLSAFDVSQTRFNRVLSVSSVPCSLLFWSESLINCTVPAGIDISVSLTVHTGGQNTTVVGLVGFRPPMLFAVVSVSAEHPNAVLYAHPATRGGSLIRVNGTDIPAPQWPIAITVGPSVCTIVQTLRTASAVVCAVPPGAGSSVAVTLYTPVQQSAHALQLSYAAPEITELDMPSNASVNGGFFVTVIGKVRCVVSES